MGALNANVFAGAKLVVTASQRGYLADILANSHCDNAKDEVECLDRMFWWLPPMLSQLPKSFAASTRRLRWQSSVPM
jgi:solute carrier family 7 (L-type amino acid transporter), member 6